MAENLESDDISPTHFEKLIKIITNSDDNELMQKTIKLLGA